MPLTAVDFYPQGPIKSADTIQFFSLFTGSMTDQPVTFANTLTVGGSQGAGSAAFRVGGVALQTANMVELRTLAADVQPVFAIDKAGKVSWGPGGGTGVDVSLTRSGANQLTLTGLAGTPALVVPVGGLQVTAGNVGVGGAPLTNVQFTITGTTTVGTSQFGIYANPVSSSGATTEVSGVYSQPQTAAAAFTATTVAGFHALNPVKGAGSTITSAIGLLVDSITSGASNYGIYVTAPGAGATSIGAYINGGLQVQTGNVGISTTPVASQGLIISGTLSGAITQLGVQATVTGGSGGTSELSGFYSALSTAAAAYTVATVAGVHVTNHTKGAGSTITGAFGLLIDAITSGNTNNYGILINAPSGGSGINMGLRNEGSAYLNGSGTAVGFYGSSGATKQTVSGAKGGNAALTSLMAALVALNLVTDTTT